MTMTVLRPALLLAAVAASSISIAAHQAAPAKPAGEPQAVRTKDIDATAVTAIVVDVIVRDRDGNPVTGLTANDFELIEDKVRAGGWLVHGGQPPGGRRRQPRPPLPPPSPRPARRRPCRRPRSSRCCSIA